MKMTSLIVLTAISLMASAQSQFTQPTRTYLMHSSGLHLKRGSDGIAKLEDASATKPQQVHSCPLAVATMWFVPTQAGRIWPCPKSGKRIS